VGKDPRYIEHHWQYVYRSYHFRGAVIMGALSAVDIALWDLAGKRFGVPVHELLGGKCRDTVRTYFHVKGETVDDLVAGCKRARELGFTAVGHLNPLLDLPRGGIYFVPHARKIEQAAANVAAFREAVGPDVDLCIEIHRRLKVHEAVALGSAIARYHPYFYEDPIKPDDSDAMAEVARNVPVAIATGERLHTIHEFEMLLRREAVQFLRPDVCMAGGITHCKKIAAAAEAGEAEVVPHNPLGPVSTAACVQLSASIPNFAIQEYPQLEAAGVAASLVDDPLRLEDGFLVVPDRPGIGINVNEAEAEKLPFRPVHFRPMLHRDGSVVDW
jgi:galactonate dehydratase